MPLPFKRTFFRTILNSLDYERRYAVKTGSLRKLNATWGAFIRENDLQSSFLFQDVRRPALRLQSQLQYHHYRLINREK